MDKVQRYEQIIAEMHNFADVADRCQLTEGNAPAAIRAWAEQIATLQSERDALAEERDEMDMERARQAGRVFEERVAREAAEARVRTLEAFRDHLVLRAQAAEDAAAGLAARVAELEGVVSSVATFRDKLTETMRLLGDEECRVAVRCVIYDLTKKLGDGAEGSTK